ncbi:hypothetical protein LR48_Vigan04g123500 [Vigna angularis]|uniref:Subtilisin-like protease n=1 Tax=Phaseolus angularis TaxID=3914 RepID=A0A0L9UES4_PHAAN|nr:subtilisin-like protease SBT1.8 [Vigna angularis]KAG2399464.1 Subtilisin-like protease [Vigna angularis]KOM41037.1 hypothetical protein LR48_Vigan04g123500 [Vigna angularis]
MASLFTFVLSLLLVAQCCWCLTLPKKTYIVHMKQNNKPSIYPTHTDWYTANLQSLTTDSDPLLYSYTHAYNGFAASLAEEQAQELLRSEDVLGVYEETVYQLHTTCTSQFLALERETGLWEGHTAQDHNQASHNDIMGDGVDVLSLSLGGGSAPYFHDTIAVGAFAAVVRGIFVSCSARNRGPEKASLANVARWIMTVGAGTLDRDFPAFAVLGNKKQYSGVSPYSRTRMGTEPMGLVYNKRLNQSGSVCMPDSLDPSLVRGKVVVCDRGINARVEKGKVVRVAGGVGMILENTEASGEELVADNHLLPAVVVGRIVGDQIRKHASSDPNPTAVLGFRGTVLNIRPSPMVVPWTERLVRWRLYSTGEDERHKQRDRE